MAEHHNALVQLTLWRLREFTREPEALFWVFAFPVLLALALGIAFSRKGEQTVAVAVESAAQSERIDSLLAANPHLRVELLNSADAAEKLRNGKVALVVVPGDPIVFRYDSTRTESLLARLLASKALDRNAGEERAERSIRSVSVTERGSRYIDFLIPGLLGMNIMGTGMWGVGFGIVRARNNKLLKRMIASPMRKWQFLAGFLGSRLVFLAGEIVAILLFGHFVFDVPVRGSILVITAVAVLGALCFSSLGLLIASRARTIEGVSGLMNLVMVPMWIGSGVFFSYANFPEVVQPFLRILPLTALNDALRAVMLDGAGALGVIGLLGIMLLWGAFSVGTAIKMFRWV